MNILDILDRSPYRGSHVNYYFPTQYLGDTITSSYLPYYLTVHNFNFKDSIVGTNEFIYKQPLIPLVDNYGLPNRHIPYRGVDKNSRSLASYITNHISFSLFASKNVLYQVGKGCIIRRQYATSPVLTTRGVDNQSVITYNTSPEILMLLVVRDSSVLSTDSIPDYSSIALLVNPIFNDLKYSILFKNIQLNYIAPLLQEGIDVIYTRNINKYCFNSEGIPQFTDIVKMQEYISGLNQSITQYEPKGLSSIWTRSSPVFS